MITLQKEKALLQTYIAKRKALHLERCENLTPCLQFPNTFTEANSGLRSLWYFPIRTKSPYRHTKITQLCTLFCTGLVMHHAQLMI